MNDAAIMIKTVWHEIPEYYDEFNVHECVVMPNHVHGIIQIISNPVGAGPRACPVCCRPNELQQKNVRPTKGQPRGVAPTMSLSDIVHRFKTLTTKQYTDGVKNNDWPRFNRKFWQRNYYEHIIRDENSYYQISEYIQTNPLKWLDDKYYA